MISRDITAKIHVSNMPPDSFGKGYMIVRRGDDASLWYFGFYQDLEKAKRVAVEIGNGIVLEV